MYVMSRLYSPDIIRRRFPETKSLIVCTISPFYKKFKEITTGVLGFWGTPDHIGAIQKAVGPLAPRSVHNGFFYKEAA